MEDKKTLEERLKDNYKRIDDKELPKAIEAYLGHNGQPQHHNFIFLHLITSVGARVAEYGLYNFNQNTLERLASFCQEGLVRAERHIMAQEDEKLITPDTAKILFRLHHAQLLYAKKDSQYYKKAYNLALKALELVKEETLFEAQIKSTIGDIAYGLFKETNDPEWKFIAIARKEQASNTYKDRRKVACLLDAAEYWSNDIHSIKNEDEQQYISCAYKNSKQALGMTSDPKTLFRARYILACTEFLLADYTKDQKYRIGASHSARTALSLAKEHDIHARKERKDLCYILKVSQ